MSFSFPSSPFETKSPAQPPAREGLLGPQGQKLRTGLAASQGRVRAALHNDEEFRIQIDAAERLDARRREVARRLMTFAEEMLEQTHESSRQEGGFSLIEAAIKIGRPIDVYVERLTKMCEASTRSKQVEGIICGLFQHPNLPVEIVQRLMEKSYQLMPHVRTRIEEALLHQHVLSGGALLEGDEEAIIKMTDDPMVSAMDKIKTYLALAKTQRLAKRDSVSTVQRASDILSGAPALSTDDEVLDAIVRAYLIDGQVERAFDLAEHFSGGKQHYYFTLSQDVSLPFAVRKLAFEKYTGLATSLPDKIFVLELPYYANRLATAYTLTGQEPPAYPHFESDILQVDSQSRPVICLALATIFHVKKDARCIKALEIARESVDALPSDEQIGMCISIIGAEHAYGLEARKTVEWLFDSIMRKDRLDKRCMDYARIAEFVARADPFFFETRMHDLAKEVLELPHGQGSFGLRESHSSVFVHAATEAIKALYP